MSDNDKLSCASAPVSTPIIDALQEPTDTAQHSTAQHSTAQHSTAAHLHVLLNPVQSHLGCNEIHDLIWEHHDRKPQQVEQSQSGKRYRGSQRIAKYGEGAKRSQGY